MSLSNKNFKIFLIIWFGQLISLFGTGMTRFALIIWAYQQTGNATTLALMGVFSFGAMVVVSPFAGVWVDRLDRRWIMIGADTGAGFATMGLLALYSANQLEIWHLYVAQLVIGSLDAFQSPAYISLTSVLMPKQHYTRVNGLRSLASSLSEVLAPMFAGAFLVAIGIAGVMWIDVITFLVAVGSLLIIRLPEMKIQSDEDEESQEKGFWQELSFGFKYIYRDKGLFYLLMIYANINFLASLTYYGVFPAMVLARTGGDELALATVQGAMGISGIIGGILVSTWGGPKRKIHNVLGVTALSFLLGDFLFGVGQNLTVWMVGALLGVTLIPFITSGNTAIWQEKVPLNIQGRIFVVQNTLRLASMPLGYLLGGLLADYVFEPAMMPNGALADTFGWLVGTGAGAGMGLMFICTATLGTLTGLSGYLIPVVRNVEDTAEQRVLKNLEVLDEKLKPVGLD